MHYTVDGGHQHLRLKRRQAIGPGIDERDDVAMPDATVPVDVHRRFDVEHHPVLEHVIRGGVQSRLCVVIDRRESHAVAGRVTIG